MASETDEYKVIVSADGTQYNSTFEKLNRTMESHLEGERKVRTNLKGLAGDLLQAGGAMEAMTAIAEHLSETFKVGLGAVVGIGIAAKAFEVVSESSKKANEEAEKFGKSIEELGRTSAFASVSDGFESIAEASKKAREGQGEHVKTAGGINTDRASMTEVEEFGLDLDHAYARVTGTADAFERMTVMAAQLAAESKEIAELNKKATAALREDAELEETKFDQGRRIVEQLELRLEREKELNALKKAGLDTPENQEAVNKKWDARADLATRIANQGAAQVALEQRLLEIKEDGGDVEVESAKARYETASQKFEDTAGDEHEKAGVEQQAALDALKASLTQRDLKMQQLRIASDTAEVTGSSDRRRLAALQLQAHALKAQSEAAGSDMERAQVDSSLRQNGAQQREIQQRRRETQIELDVQSRIAEIKSKPLLEVGEQQRKAADLGGEIAILQQKLNSPEALSDPQARQGIANQLKEKQDQFSLMRDEIGNGLSLGGISSLARVGGGGGVGRGDNGKVLLSKIDEQTKILQAIASNTASGASGAQLVMNN